MTAPFRVTESHGYTIARAEPTQREPLGRTLATAGHDMYGDYVTWGGTNFLYCDATEVESLLLTIAGCRA